MLNILATLMGNLPYGILWRGSSQFYINRFIRIFSLYLPIAVLCFLRSIAKYEILLLQPVQRLTRFTLLGSDWLSQPMSFRKNFYGGGARNNRSDAGGARKMCPENLFVVEMRPVSITAFKRVALPPTLSCGTKASVLLTTQHRQRRQNASRRRASTIENRVQANSSFKDGTTLLAGDRWQVELHERSSIAHVMRFSARIMGVIAASRYIRHPKKSRVMIFAKL